MNESNKNIELNKILDRAREITKPTPEQIQKNKRIDKVFRHKLQLIGWVAFLVVNSIVNLLTDERVFSISFNFNKRPTFWQDDLQIPMTLSFICLFGLSLYYLSLFWHDPKTDRENRNVMPSNYFALYSIWIAFRVTGAFLMALFPTTIIFSIIRKYLID